MLHQHCCLAVGHTTIRVIRNSGPGIYPSLTVKHYAPQVCKEWQKQNFAAAEHSNGSVMQLQQCRCKKQKSNVWLLTGELGCTIQPAQ